MLSKTYGNNLGYTVITILLRVKKPVWWWGRRTSITVVKYLVFSVKAIMKREDDVNKQIRSRPALQLIINVYFGFGI